MELLNRPEPKREELGEIRFSFSRLKLWAKIFRYPGISKYEVDIHSVTAKPPRRTSLGPTTDYKETISKFEFKDKDELLARLPHELREFQRDVESHGFISQGYIKERILALHVNQIV